MEFAPHTDADVGQMLDALGLSSVDELFAPIPASLRFEGELDIPRGKSEIEVLRDLGALADVRSVHDLHVWTLGHGRVALSCHLVVARIDRSEALLTDAYALLGTRHRIDHATIQVEPESLRDASPRSGFARRSCQRTSATSFGETPPSPMTGNTPATWASARSNSWFREGRAP